VRKRHPSILWVLGWRLSLVSAVFLMITMALLQSKLQTAAESLFHQALEDEAHSVAARLIAEPGGRIGFLRPNTSVPERSALRYRVIGMDGRLLFASLDLPDRLARWHEGESGAGPAGLKAGQLNIFKLGPPVFHDHFIGATLATTVGDQTVLVQVFADLDERGVLLDDLVHHFFFEAGWLLVPFVAILLLVILVSIWVQLRPLAKVSRMAGEIGPETTGQRLPEEGQPREAVPLIRSVNRALERLDQGFQMQRQFTADAAHELRTPLAVLGAHLDTLPASPAVTALRQEVAVMSRLVSQLLRIAQLDALTLTPSDRVDLHAVAVDAASALAPLALKAGKSIELGGSEQPVWVRGDAEVLSQAIRNLVENALHHTPRGTTVHIELGTDGTLRVSDHGPGVAPENRELIFHRFWRADRRPGGAGLGLAIVAKVAETHGGRIHVEDAPGGGACFVLELPASPEQTLREPAAPAETPKPEKERVH
jgi:signal transduction histidine kinase